MSISVKIAIFGAPTAEIRGASRRAFENLIVLARPSGESTNGRGRVAALGIGVGGDAVQFVEDLLGAAEGEGGDEHFAAVGFVRGCRKF